MIEQSLAVERAAWIDTLEEDEVSGRLVDLYQAALDPESGRLDHILKVHALHPAGFEAHLKLYRTVMRSTRSLPKVDREMIGVVVSKLNGCHY